MPNATLTSRSKIPQSSCLPKSMLNYFTCGTMKMFSAGLWFSHLLFI